MEVQYNPEAPQAGFSPVKQVDSTRAMQANHDKSIRDMNQRLQQMDRNAAVRLQNMRDQAFPVEQLAQFSKTLEGIVGKEIERRKEDDMAEGAMLAFTEGVAADKEFDRREAEIKREGEKVNANANAYEQQTGDIETAERVRSLTGWKKYGYAKAQMEMAAKGFGSFMESNKSNEEYAVNVGGQMYTLASAPDQPTRQAVAAKMATAYMSPYSGMNKSFLGKYLYPGMQQGMQSAINSVAQDSAKLLRANRLDAAQTAFRGSPTPDSMKELSDTLRNDGYDNKTIRAYIVGEMVKIKSDDEFEALMATPYGPNGQAFEKQYPLEAAELRVNRRQFLQRGVQEKEMALQTQDRESLIQAKEAVIKDREDGSFDANPERLKELANAARAAGNEKTADFWQSQISETAHMKNSEAAKEQILNEMEMGVIPSREEIMQNPALTMDAKRELVQKAGATGMQEPKTELSKSHKEQIKESINSRAGITPMGKQHPGATERNYYAWKRYRQVYNAQIRNGKTEDEAAEIAMSDFKSAFGTDKTKGEYALIDNPAEGDVGVYAAYNASGVESYTTPNMTQVEEKFTYGSGREDVLNNTPSLYQAENTDLEKLTNSFTTTGKIGTIPDVYYELRRKFYPTKSMVDIVNMRLKANGYDELPSEITEPMRAVEGTFDEDTYKYINYKPNPTRTDIGMVNAGQEPVYSTSLPIDVASDMEFQQEVSAVAGRLGISEADLMAVMSFETGGTFNPGIRNSAGSGATGLIQFMPSTAKGLGTTTQALAQMPRAEQMQYVEKYLSNKNLKGKGLSDIYMGVLFPAAVGQPDDFVLFGNGATTRGYGAGSAAYRQNKGLDSNGDGSVTKAEASAKVLRHRHPSPWRRPNNMRLGL